MNRIVDIIKGHRAVSIVVLLLLAGTIPLTLLQLKKIQDARSHAGGGQVAVILSPLTQTVKTGDPLEVKVTLNSGGNDISAIDITFAYPSDLLTLIGTGIDDGRGSGSSTFSAVLNNNTDSSVHYVGVNPSNVTIEGSNITIGTLHFRTKAVGNATVGFSNIHINGAGVAGALPVDSTNTKIGQYTISDTASSCVNKPDSCKNQQGNSITLTQDNNGVPIHVGVGNTITVKLPTGFWNFIPKTTSIIEEVAQSTACGTIATNPKRVGLSTILAQRTDRSIYFWQDKLTPQLASGVFSPDEILNAFNSTSGNITFSENPNESHSLWLGRIPGGMTGQKGCGNVPPASYHGFTPGSITYTGPTPTLPPGNCLGCADNPYPTLDPTVPHIGYDGHGGGLGTGDYVGIDGQGGTIPAGLPAGSRKLLPNVHTNQDVFHTFWVDTHNNVYMSDLYRNGTNGPAIKLSTPSQTSIYLSNDIEDNGQYPFTDQRSWVVAMQPNVDLWLDRTPLQENNYRKTLADTIVVFKAKTPGTTHILASKNWCNFNGTSWLCDKDKSFDVEVTVSSDATQAECSSPAGGWCANTTTPTPTSGPIPTTNPQCPLHSKGDANCDGKITIADYAIWISNFLSDSHDGKADFNNSNSITIADYAIWISSFLRLQL